ncbi:hypothetical protein MSG28_003640 [Choristoneura fumiferana]|uniref:Uncharacterized protein n=1 Tax=Choristoneura fumiferana TaxID=7141 RepID=A0ACC0KG54_CHOFU|nr:hypothetical protein MSG28_003640 [Choristoneura fumiferana]
MKNDASTSVGCVRQIGSDGARIRFHDRKRQTHGTVAPRKPKIVMMLMVLSLLLQREGAARSDAERERRARGDWEARARAAETDAARLAAKLHAAQREISRFIRRRLFFMTRPRQAALATATTPNMSEKPREGV